MSLLRLSPALREVRLILCQSSSASAGARQFVDEHYVQIKKEYPTLPFLVRECSEVTPMLYGRIAYGAESSVDLTNYTSTEVREALSKLAQPKVDKAATG